MEGRSKVIIGVENGEIVCNTNRIPENRKNSKNVNSCQAMVFQLFFLIKIPILIIQLEIQKKNGTINLLLR